MKIKIIGKFYDNHSLSIVNRNIAISLANAGISISIWPLDKYDDIYGLSQDTLEILEKLKKDTNEVPDVEIRHTYPPMFNYPVSDKTKIIFIQPWEWNRVPFEWQYKFETFADVLITPSKWSGISYLNGGLKQEKLYIVPNGVNPKIFNKENRLPLNKRVNPIFRYTFVGNAQYRKGLDILLEAWHKSFTKADNVELYIKDNPMIYGTTNILDEIIKLQYKSGCATIIYDDNQLSEEQMAELYRNTDVIVHPYRAEGFGMHLQEAMACGAYPIATGGGPTDEFITDDVGMRLEAGVTAVDANDGKYFVQKPGDSLSLMGHHTLAFEPNLQALCGRMKYLYYHHERDKVLVTVNKAKLTSWDDVANSIANICKNLSNKKKPTRET